MSKPAKHRLHSPRVRRPVEYLLAAAIVRASGGDSVIVDLDPPRYVPKVLRRALVGDAEMTKRRRVQRARRKARRTKRRYR